MILCCLLPTKSLPEVLPDCSLPVHKCTEVQVHFKMLTFVMRERQCQCGCGNASVTPTLLENFNAFVVGRISKKFLISALKSTLF